MNYIMRQKAFGSDERKMKREAGQVVPPPFYPLAGNPASLTEGD